MALSKRTRYEVLRRDNYTCRYCRATDAPLTVDHVTPTALGGSDDPSNLVAACKDCNAGKTSTSPDAQTVSDVADDAVRWAKAIAAAADAALADRKANARRHAKFLKEWKAWDPNAAMLAPDWKASVDQWTSAGLPLDLAVDAVTVGMSNRNVTGRNVFRYVAGICWSRIREMQEAAAATLEPVEEVSEWDEAWADANRQHSEDDLVQNFIDRRWTRTVERLYYIPEKESA